MRDNKRFSFHYGYIIVACCCLIMGVDVGLAMSCAGIFYEPVCQSIGVSTGEFSIYMSLSFLTSTLTLGVAGKMMARYSARMLLTFTSAMLGLTIVAMSLFTSLWEFYMAGCLMGISLAFLLYLSFPIMINRWFHSNVGFLIGICSAASGIGGILFNPIGGWIITNWGWQAGYAAFGVLILLVVTPLLAIFLRDNPSDKGLVPVGCGLESKKSDKMLGTFYADAVHSSAFYLLLLFAFLIMASSTLYLFLPKYAGAKGYSIEQGALVAAAAMGGVTIGKLALGWINDRSYTIGVFTSTLTGIGGLIMMLLCAQWFVLVACGAFLFGWCYAAVTVQTATLVRAAFGNLDYARIYSVISIALAAGGTVASGAWGFIVDHTSFRFIFLMGVAMLGICLIGGMRVLKLRSKDDKNEDYLETP